MKKSILVKALSVISMVFLIASSALAQVTRKTAPRPKSAVVAVMKGGKLEFAREQEKMMSAIQKAVDSTARGTLVKSFYLKTLGKTSYLGIRLGDREKIAGTIFLDLVPAGSGVAGIFVIGSGQSYCTSNLCGSCEPNGQGGCTCATDPLIGIAGECHLQPKHNFVTLASNLNLAFLADGFDGVDGSAPMKAVDVKVSTKTP